MTEQNPDLLALREGLPEGPWKQSALDDRDVIGNDGWLIAYVSNQRDPRTITNIARAIAAIPSRLEEIERLRTALDESVNLQSRYAFLLNFHDGGKRLRFASAAEWLQRLAILAKTETDQ